MNELALFAGSGGGILGGVLLGWRTVCAVEINSYCARRLMQRQNEGHLPPFPIWDDVCTFDGRPWRGTIDVISGGFPCQDISSAGGPGREGITGKKSGLWREYFRIICEVEPHWAIVENSPMLTGRGLDVVLGDLASIRYDAKWGVFSASDLGAQHERERIWIVANNRDSNCVGTQQKRSVYAEQPAEPLRILQKTEWKAEDRMDREFDGMASWVERHRATGNGQVPAVVAHAWNRLV